MSVTICYISARLDNRFEWALDALINQGFLSNPDERIIYVDYHYRNQNRDGFGFYKEVNGRFEIDDVLLHTDPMPSVWYGDSRLTKENWFDASSFRNTALVHCRTKYICYLDDLSLPLPGFVDAVRNACHGNKTITLGRYAKAMNMVVENGNLKSIGEITGKDARMIYGDRERNAKGGELFGCSLVAPIEAFLEIGGWPSSLCGSLGFEDCITGEVLSNAGYNFIYNPRMMTYESEELHHVGERFLKHDWHFVDGKPVQGGNGGSDMSHAALNIAKQSKRFDNGYDIRALREHMLNGGTWPDYLGKNPIHQWFTKQLLSEM